MKKTKLVITILVLITIFSFIAMLVALNRPYKKEINTFKKPVFDETAEAGKPIVNEELKYSLLKISNSIKLYICANLKYENNMVYVYATNVDTNTIWIKVRILDSKRNILGETGIIKPNEYVKSIKLNREIKSKEKVLLKIMEYEIDTYMSLGSIELEAYITK